MDQQNTNNSDLDSQKIRVQRSPQNIESERNVLQTMLNTNETNSADRYFNYCIFSSTFVRIRDCAENQHLNKNVSSISFDRTRKSRIISMRLTKMEKDKIFYDETGLITLQQGLEVQDLMLYGWGLTNESSVKFTSISGDLGDNCKSNESKID